MKITYLNKNGFMKSVIVDASKWDMDTPYKISTYGFWIDKNDNIYENAANPIIDAILIPPSRLVCIEFVKDKEDRNEDKLNYGIKNGSVCNVNFGSLPFNAEFLHKDKVYRKVDEEHAVDMDGKKWVMEPHYGALITKIQFDNYKLTNDAIYD